MSKEQVSGTLRLGLIFLGAWAVWAALGYAYVVANAPLKEIIRSGPIGLGTVIFWGVVSMVLLFLGILYSLRALRYRLGG